MDNPQLSRRDRAVHAGRKALLHVTTIVVALVCGALVSGTLGIDCDSEVWNRVCLFYGSDNGLHAPLIHLVGELYIAPEALGLLIVASFALASPVFALQIASLGGWHFQSRTVNVLVFIILAAMLQLAVVAFIATYMWELGDVIREISGEIGPFGYRLWQRNTLAQTVLGPGYAMHCPLLAALGLLRFHSSSSVIGYGLYYALAPSGLALVLFPTTLVQSVAVLLLVAAFYGLAIGIHSLRETVSMRRVEPSN